MGTTSGGGVGVGGGWVLLLLMRTSRTAHLAHREEELAEPTLAVLPGHEMVAGLGLLLLLV